LVPEITCITSVSHKVGLWPLLVANCDQLVANYDQLVANYDQLVAWHNNQSRGGAMVELNSKKQHGASSLTDSWIHVVKLCRIVLDCGWFCALFTIQLDTEMLHM